MFYPESIIIPKFGGAESIKDEIKSSLTADSSRMFLPFRIRSHIRFFKNAKLLKRDNSMKPNAKKYRDESKEPEKLLSVNSWRNKRFQNSKVSKNFNKSTNRCSHLFIVYVTKSSTDRKNARSNHAISGAQLTLNKADTSPDEAENDRFRINTNLTYNSGRYNTSKPSYNASRSVWARKLILPLFIVERCWGTKLNVMIHLYFRSKPLPHAEIKILFMDNYKDWPRLRKERPAERSPVLKNLDGTF